MRRWTSLAAAVVLALLAAEPANACATCFGAADSSLTAGMNGAIVTLLGIVGAVQLGFVALFATFLVRSRRMRQRKENFRLIRGGAR